MNPGCSPRELYIEYSGTEDALLNPLSEMLDQSALGLMDYFETAIESLLLYKPERPMFCDLAEKLKQDAKTDSENNGEFFYFLSTINIFYFAKYVMVINRSLNYKNNFKLAFISKHLTDSGVA